MIRWQIADNSRILLSVCDNLMQEEKKTNYIHEFSEFCLTVK